MTPLTPTELNALAEKVEALDGPSREVDAEIAWRLHWRWDDWEEGDLCIEDRPLVYVKERMEIGHNSIWRNVPRYTASVDAAMTLGKGMPWLVPIINYSDRSVRLANGLGFPVGGNDHLSLTAGDMCCAVTAAWLRARAASLLTEEGA